MTDRIIIEGTAGTAPQVRTLPSGRQVANLRVASTLRKQDPSTGQWSDAGTNWYSVAVWGDVADHVAASIRQGDPVLVTGRLRIAAWGDGERQGTSVEIDADAIGHSLRFGTTTFQRRPRAAAESAPIARAVESAPSAKADERGWAMPGAVRSQPASAPDPAHAPVLAQADAELPF